MMNCMGPITPEDADLLAYADNAASPAVQEHVSACLACHVRAHDLDRVQRSLQSLLYRAGCPSSLELGEYHLKLLSEQPASEVTLHLAHCPACRGEIEDLAAFMARVRQPVVEVTQDLFGAMRTIQAQLSAGPLGGSYGAPAPALRGPADDARHGPLVYNAEDILVTVDSWVERLGQPGRAVAGLVIGPEDFAQAEATMGAKELPITSPIDDLGNFLFSDVSPGVHHLMIRLPATGLQIEIDELLVK